MSRFTRLLDRFATDDRGVFAVMFGVIAIVLIAMGGAVVDYVWLEQTRNRAQIAIDAAALALQPRIFEPGFDDDAREELRVLAEAIMIERIGDPRVTAVIDDVQTVIDDGSLYFHARVTMPTIFVALVGVRELDAAVQTEATRKKLALEVVMVLDNSGSMSSENRMTRLVDAAKCATNILFYSETVSSGNAGQSCVAAANADLVEDVMVGVVPFTMYVNVGSGNANQPWIDRYGASVISNDNFDNDDNDATPFNGVVNRLALYDQIPNDEWRGCVEARPHIQTGSSTQFLDTDDTTPTSGQPNTLFVPLFAPDLPDTLADINGILNNYVSDHPASCRVTGTCTWTESKERCSSYNNCSGAITNSYSLSGRDRGSLSCSCSSSGPWASDTGTGSYTGSGSNRIYTRTRTCSFQYDAQNLSQRELQERLCKYNTNLTHNTGQKGPNADCPVQPMQPLTDDPDAVLGAIGNMVALGGTNIHEGTAWGFRALSPTPPFEEGAPYDEATSKVLIVMTDGENTAYRTNNLNGSQYYSAYGFPFNSRNTNANSSSNGNVDRLGTISWTNAQIVAEMNTRTEATCTNAKAEGITIYTIGLATHAVTQSTPARVRQMLTNCATTPDRAHFPATSAELKEVFEAIANDLSALRLAQ